MNTQPESRNRIASWIIVFGLFCSAAWGSSYYYLPHVADGALGFWGALREVYPQTQEQRCWVHKLRNVLDKLPKRLQARAKDLLREAMQAPDRASAEEAIARFAREYEAAYPKAASCLTEGQEHLLTFFAFPAQHWQHLRTTNPIESPFATVKARTDVQLLHLSPEALAQFRKGQKDGFAFLVMNIARMLSVRLREANLRLSQR
jgi:transposase-like protein